MEPYLSRTQLNEDVFDCLQWWGSFLRDNHDRRVRTQFSGTLIPMYGDGSGTSTSGTVTLLDSSPLIWSGTWISVVYKFLSNYKELNTLRIYLINIKAQGDPIEYEGSMVFYFTDNMVMYYICKSGSLLHKRLHQLIKAIQLLKLHRKSQTADMTGTDSRLIVDKKHVPGRTSLLSHFRKSN